MNWSGKALSRATVGAWLVDAAAQPDGSQLELDPDLSEEEAVMLAERALETYTRK